MLHLLHNAQVYRGRSVGVARRVSLGSPHGFTLKALTKCMLTDIPECNHTPARR